MTQERLGRERAGRGGAGALGEAGGTQVDAPGDRRRGLQRAQPRYRLRFGAAVLARDGGAQLAAQIDGSL